MKQKYFDSLGRIHIPKRIRDSVGFTEEMAIQIKADSKLGVITIERQDQTCTLCKNTDDLIQIEKGIFFCESCLQKIKDKK